jgi:hypothetical protein
VYGAFAAIAAILSTAFYFSASRQRAMEHAFERRAWPAGRDGGRARA